MLSRKQVVFVENGRLGNQLFQYCGLSEVLKPQETLALVGFNSLFATFDGVKARQVVRTNRLLSAIVMLSMVIDRFSLSRNLEGRLTSRTSEPDSTFPALILARRGFFDQPSVLDSFEARQLRFRPDVHRAAAEALETLSVAPHAYVFVHVRCGDYRYWPLKSHPAVLPNSWIVHAVQELRKVHGFSVPLLVFGDDEMSCREVARSTGGMYVNISPSVDLLLMSLARAAVLSASTFALWGANLARLQHGAQGPWLAPELWGGVRLGQWFPAHLRIEWLRYLDVRPFLEEVGTPL
jgi:hypothetical protein